MSNSQLPGWTEVVFIILNTLRELLFSRRFIALSRTATTDLGSKGDEVQRVKKFSKRVTCIAISIICHLATL
jgi:hypothetical protein